jgi:hypothetical protein
MRLGCSGCTYLPSRCRTMSPAKEAKDSSGTSQLAG